MEQTIRKQKLRLGDMLIAEGYITPEQLTMALQEQKEKHTKLGRTLIDLRYIDERTLLNKISEQLKLPIVDLSTCEIDLAVAAHLPEKFARRFNALVLNEKEGKYTLAISDPTDILALDQLHEILKRPLEVVIAYENELLARINTIYRRTDDISDYAVELSKDLEKSTQKISTSHEKTLENTPIERLLMSIFEDALQMRASDIHIEPEETFLRIRQRIDGELHEQIMPENRVGSALVQRLKLMADLNIAEKRLPQDGRFQFTVKNTRVDVRLSTIPTQNGESAVMRLLDHSKINSMHMGTLGLSAENLTTLRNIMSLPYGLLLVTGPTGSGKTTTLYSALNELNKESVKIITVEDPVEYRLPRVTQVQVNAKIDLDFSVVLRSVLRQDPDIVMIGEIRDSETASIAVRAALTGHFVFATVHTNDTPSTVTRLINMGVPGYLLASSLRGVIAQRLVRRICPTCKIEITPTDEEKILLTKRFGKDAANKKYYAGKGCSICYNTGYQGRIGVFELLALNREMLTMLSDDQLTPLTGVMEKSLHGKQLADDAFRLAGQGITTISEVFCLTGNLDAITDNESSQEQKIEKHDTEPETTP